MPQSKHRRKGRPRPRATELAPPPRNPDPSPPWVPIAGVVLLILGILVVLAGYLVPPLQDALAGLPLFGPNWSLVAGFVLLAGGLITLTRWQ